jgi:hypothetical protein
LRDKIDVTDDIEKELALFNSFEPLAKRIKVQDILNDGG